ncbi:MAG: ABC transporter permease, partial [Desulfomonilaceae bacterium]
MNKLVRELLPFGSLLLLIAVLSLWQPESFLTADNFLNVLRRSSVYGIMAVGMTFVIISGGIDLSVGSLLALCGMCAAGVMVWLGGPAPSSEVRALGTAAGLLTGAAGGFVSGALIAKLNIQPFIATLGTMSLYRGIALVMHDGQPINIPTYRYLGEGACFGIPVSILLFLAVIV